jgi:pimeloyl-ACP methyl ester carboxylesterase
VTRPLDNHSSLGQATRVSWRFSADGQSAVCTVVPLTGSPVLEISELGPTGPLARTTLAVPSLGLHSQLLPISQGRVLICHHHDGGQQIDLVASGDGAPSVRRLVTAQLAGLRLVPLPAGPGPTLAVAVSHSADGRSTIWELREDGALIPLAITPGIFTGGTWLDREGRCLGGELSVDGHPCNGVSVDLPTGSCEVVLSLSAASNDRFAAFNPATGVLVVSTDLTGEIRLGVGRPDDGPVGFPTSLHRAGNEARLIALDAKGNGLLVAHEIGAVSQLSVYDWTSSLSTDVQAPPGVAVGGGVLDRSRAHLVYSTPSRPAALAALRRSGPRWSMANAGTNPSGEPEQIFARTVTFSGAVGPVETVTYGQPYQADQVVIALHGGPLNAWRLGFNPVLHALAANGIAVVAPNQRGSTQYGVAHALAIRHAWGGPDLDDILAIARAVRSDRASSAARPIVFGSSYGAFLALLAAAIEPGLWGGCVAQAPFLSGPRLYAEAGEPTRRLIERLGGLSVPVVDGEARDVFERCGEIEAPVLLIHGTEDDVVPVSQSRLLHRRLVALRHPNTEFLELPGGHDPTTGCQREIVIERVVRFCQQADIHARTDANPPYQLLERR